MPAPLRLEISGAGQDDRPAGIVRPLRGQDPGIAYGGSPSCARWGAQNVDHDRDYAAMVLVNWLVTTVGGVPVPVSGGLVARNRFVWRCASGDVPEGVPPAPAAILTRHAPAAARMNDFVWRLFDGDLQARYPRP